MEPQTFWMMAFESAYLLAVITFCLLLFAFASAPEGSPGWHGLFSLYGIMFLFCIVYTSALTIQMLAPNTWVTCKVKGVDSADVVRVKNGYETKTGTVPFVVALDPKTKTEYIVSFLYVTGRPTMKPGAKCEVCVEKGVMGTKVVRFRYKDKVYRTVARL